MKKRKARQRKQLAGSWQRTAGAAKWRIMAAEKISAKQMA